LPFNTSSDIVFDNPLQKSKMHINKMKINVITVEQLMEFYDYETGQSAGLADDIWPYINEKYTKYPNLGVRQLS
jgi:hypothetical protein